MTDTFGYGPIIPLRDFAPDKPLHGPHLVKAKNTFFYDGAYRGINRLSSAEAIDLPASSGRYVHGAFFVAIGTLFNILATERRLYLVNQENVVDVSRNGQDYSSSSRWRSLQWRDDILFTNGKNPIQIYHTRASSSFSNAIVNPDAPIAENMAVVSDQLFVSNGNTVYSSGYGNLEQWNDATVGAINQPVETGGNITGIIGGERAVTLHEEAIDLWTPAGGDLVFTRDRISDSIGLLAPESLIEVDGFYYLYSTHGFIRINPDAEKLDIGNIGKERIDQTVRKRHGRRASLMKAIHDPVMRLIYFGVPSQDNGLMDMFYIYSYVEDKWTDMEMTDLIPSLIYYNREAPINLSSSSIETRTFGNFEGKFGDLRFRAGDKEMVAACEVAGEPKVCHFTGKKMVAEFQTGVVPPSEFIDEEADPKDRGAVVKYGHRSYTNSIRVIGDYERLGVSLVAGDNIIDNRCLTETELEDRLEIIQADLNRERAKMPPDEIKIVGLEQLYDRIARAVVCHNEVNDLIESSFGASGSGLYMGVSIKVYEGFNYIMGWQASLRDDGIGNL